jgi:primosomal protein N' (replication factor Y)
MKAEHKHQQFEILLPTAVDQAFDYLAPENMPLKAGDIVTVPFGKGKSLGVVWGKGTASLPAGKIKTIVTHHSQFPAITEDLRKFIDWASWYNCAPRGSMLKMLLPVDEIEKAGRVHLNTEIDVNKINLTPLSTVQKNAADNLAAKLENGFSVTLLDGVTGSGKTEVYFDSIARTLRAECKDNETPNPKPQTQILILLPEIGLSVQWLKRFEARFGFAPVVWHSGITPAKKRASWQKIASGEARVIIGARSSLFLPYKNLSLIIVDEEHDPSYKQEEGVIYHARDMAVARARFQNFPVILVSATPSLESYHNARQGKYEELSLPMRHGEAVMPDIHIIDMRKENLTSGHFISGILREKLAQAIASGHQAMLFLNRRGYAPLMLCRKCGHRFQCPDCSAWLVAHKKGASDQLPEASKESTVGNRQLATGNLQCHHCGYRIPIPNACPSCAAEDTLHPCGPGVERLLEEVGEFMPQARVAVMASDSMGSYSDMSQIINGMAEKNIDLLIGTQMIAKGHHFADLAVVGVVDADLGLAGGDLRASERTYQLLHQLSGRAGRESVRGQVYLQSFLPEHPVIKALISGERNQFLAAELAARENAAMPPFSRLAAIIVEGEKEEAVIKTANELASSFAKLHTPNSKLKLYGPAPAPLFMLRGKFRYRLMVKADRAINLPDMMRAWTGGIKAPSTVRIKLDIDPQSFL